MNPRVMGVASYLPTYDVRSAHEIWVAAPAVNTYQAARHLDMGGSLTVAGLAAIRGLPHLLSGKMRARRSITLETLLELGFTVLDEERPSLLVLGAVGRFWRPDSGLVRIAPEEFGSFHEPGYAKGVVGFLVEQRGEGSLLTTETRVACMDASARRRFSFYWRLIGPFSGLIRRIMLEEVKRSAEKG